MFNYSKLGRPKMKDKPMKGFAKGVQWFEQKMYNAKPKRVHEHQGIRWTAEEMAPGKPNEMHVKHEQVSLGMLEFVFM